MVDKKELREGIFISRVNRFVCECVIDGKRVFAHLPNSGRLLEILFKGVKIYALRISGKSILQYRLIFAEKEGMPILIDTNLTNIIAKHLIEKNMIPSLKGYSVSKKEVSLEGNRFDLLLERAQEKLIIEVKNSTLFWKSLSMFPDCETKRGKKHIEGLVKAKDDKTDCGILFIVSSPKVTHFLPDFHNDYAFSKELLKAKDVIRVYAICVGFDSDFSISEVKEIKIPWEVLAEVGEDSGAYLLIMNVSENRNLLIGAIGEKFLRKGYYVYVGSARKNLKNRISRHFKRQKKLHWHIDFLTINFRPFFVFPVRAQESYECEIAYELSKISDWSILAFGSSDCSCETHLFGFENNPMDSLEFINLLLYFRMGILEKQLQNN